MDMRWPSNTKAGNGKKLSCSVQSRPVQGFGGDGGTVGRKAFQGGG